MATKASQRWGIMIVTIALVIGTLGSFMVMIWNQNDQSKLQQEFSQAQAKLADFQKQQQDLQNAQGDELSLKYYDQFSQYESQPKAFDIDSVKSLSSEDLSVGNGTEINGTTKFAVYYIGWDANGHVFDQSVDTANKKLKPSLPISSGLDSASLVKGWITGLKGMHIGGVRLLSIPSDQAYGEAGQKDSSGQVIIAPNMPLKFIVMAVDLPAPIPQPAGYQDALDQYTKVYGELNK
ncbi:MAG: FKBP-type peptidyl-prolyl cis-trans isomerase [Candidatus Saccharimonas sp.]